MTDKIVTFAVTQVFWPNIFVPRKFGEDEDLTYSLAILAEEVPTEVRPFVKGRDTNSGFMASFRSKLKPTLVVDGDKYALSTTLQCARDANLEIDALLTKSPVALALNYYEFEARVGPRRGDTIQGLALRAIKIKDTDMVRRFDELCAEFFTS